MLNEEYLQLIGNCYEIGSFESLFEMIAEDCLWESEWRIDVEKGKQEVVAYYQRKGAILQRCRLFPHYVLVELFGAKDTILGMGILLSQWIEGKIKDLILILRVGETREIKYIRLCMKELFRYRKHDMSQQRY